MYAFDECIPLPMSIDIRTNGDKCTHLPIYYMYFTKRENCNILLSD